MFLKRALASLGHCWGKNLALVLLYTILFAVLLGLLSSYLAVDRQVDFLQSTLGSSVTLHPVTVETQAGPRILPLAERDIETFADSPLVRGCNAVAQSSMVDMDNAEPVVNDYARGFYEYQLANTPADISADGVMFPIWNSEYYEAFTMYGYRLTQGRHFTREDRNAVLISEALAAQNNLSLGDEMVFSTCNYVKNHLLHDESEVCRTTLKIVGLFAPPNREENGYSDRWVYKSLENAVFASAAGTNGVLYNSDGQISRATVYLHNAGDMDAFLEETQSKLNIEDVVGAIGGSTIVRTEMDYTSYREQYLEHPSYFLVLDREFYSYVAGPMENTRTVLRGFLTALLAGSLVILLLLAALLVRGRTRELGVLMAMGESRGKIAGQICLELTLPLLVSILLGTALSGWAVVPRIEAYTAGLLQSMVSEGQADREELIREFGDAEDDAGVGSEDALWDRSLNSVVVAGKLDFALDGGVYGAFFGVCLAALAAALAVQLGILLRIRPARLLTGTI